MSELIKSEAEELMQFFKQFQTALGYTSQKMINDPIFRNNMIEAGIGAWSYEAIAGMNAINQMANQNQGLSKTRDFGLQQR